MTVKFNAFLRLWRHSHLRVSTSVPKQEKIWGLFFFFPKRWHFEFSEWFLSPLDQLDVSVWKSSRNWPQKWADLELDGGFSGQRFPHVSMWMAYKHQLLSKTPENVFSEHTEEKKNGFFTLHLIIGDPDHTGHWAPINLLCIKVNIWSLRLGAVTKTHLQLCHILYINMTSHMCLCSICSCCKLTHLHIFQDNFIQICLRYDTLSQLTFSLLSLAT